MNLENLILDVHGLYQFTVKLFTESEFLRLWHKGFKFPALAHRFFMKLLINFTFYKLILLKYVPHEADVPPIYLLIKHSHSIWSKYFLRCLNMMFALVWMHFDVNFHISKSFVFSNLRRGWNRATSFWSLVFDIAFRNCILGQLQM